MENDNRYLCTKEFATRNELEEYIFNNKVDVVRKEILIEASRRVYILKFWVD